MPNLATSMRSGARAAWAAYFARPITPLREGEVLEILPSGKRGIWRTIGGRAIPIEVEKGLSIPEAVRKVEAQRGEKARARPAADPEAARLDADLRKQFPQMPTAMREKTVRQMRQLANLPRSLPGQPRLLGMAEAGEVTQGKCYDYAAKFALENEKATLVHGTITPPLGEFEGREIGHAWVDMGDDRVFDPSSQSFFEKESYYAGFGAREERRYEGHDVIMKKLLKQKFWGPWHETRGIINKPPRRGKRS